MITSRDKLIKNLHKLYREDPFINELFTTTGITLDNLADTIIDLENQKWFDTMTWYIDVMEKELNFKTNPNSSIEDRRSQLQARWRSNGKADIYLLQNVADSYKNGEIEVDLVDGKLKCTFVGEIGIPSDIDSLKKSLDDVKPAHLAIIYAFKYLCIKDVNMVMTLQTLQQQKLNLFAFEKENEKYLGSLDSFTCDQLTEFTYNQLTNYLYVSSTNSGELSDYTNNELTPYENNTLTNYLYGN
jgi:hypothetical protein